MVDRGQHELTIAREILHRLGSTTGADDRDQIVNADIALHELPGRDPRACGPLKPRVHVVEDQDEDAAFEGRAIGRDVRSDRVLRKERWIRMLDRDIHRREDRQRLGMAVLGNLKVFLRQVPGKIALRIGDYRIDLDVVHFHPEGHRRGLSVGTWRRRLLSNRND